MECVPRRLAKEGCRLKFSRLTYADVLAANRLPVWIEKQQEPRS
jgi:hypothetical protein